MREDAQRFAIELEKKQLELQKQVCQILHDIVFSNQVNDKEFIDDVIMDLYFGISRFDQFMIMRIFEIGLDEFLEKIRSKQWPVYCCGCTHEIPMTFQDIEDYDRFHRIIIYCEKCSETMRKKMQEEGRERHFAIQERIRELRDMPYQDYLNSPEWQKRRKETLVVDGYSCRICSSKESLNVHHRTYERLGEEGPLDLITLCQPCHQLFHDNGRLTRPE